MIDIIMSVLNGEKYLEEMLTSLRQQTYSDWRLIVRNNGSTDSTSEILWKFKSTIENEVIIIDSKNEMEVVYDSFYSLFEFVTNKYIMFADGDDFWLPNKIKTQYTILKK